MARQTSGDYVHAPPLVMESTHRARDMAVDISYLQRRCGQEGHGSRGRTRSLVACFHIRRCLVRNVLLRPNAPFFDLRTPWRFAPLFLKLLLLCVCLPSGTFPSFISFFFANIIKGGFRAACDVRHWEGKFPIRPLHSHRQLIICPNHQVALCFRWASHLPKIG